MNELPLIPGYRIEKELGRGGMATVYLGVQEKLKRRVAIKVLSPLLLQDQNFARRFLKEAETAANLHHANIIAIHDVGQTGNTYYIIMEYLANGSLKDIINKGPVEPNQALRVISQVAGALDYAHRKGFIHRDIKPDNILFREDGTPVLTDFGIARTMDSTTKLTKTGMSIGTPHYMSPEQARSKQLDGRSDLYSLGIVLYEMLTGKVPYDAEDSVSIAIQHIQEPVPVLPMHLSTFQPLLDKFLAKNQADRFKTSNEVQDVMDGFSEKTTRGTFLQNSIPKSASSKNEASSKKIISLLRILNPGIPDTLIHRGEINEKSQLNTQKAGFLNKSNSSKKKIPALAVLLSMIFPGVGSIYSRKIKKGLVYLFLFIVFLFVLLQEIEIVLTLSPYSFSILNTVYLVFYFSQGFDAFLDAKNHNNYSKQKSHLSRLGFLIFPVCFILVLIIVFLFKEIDSNNSRTKQLNIGEFIRKVENDQVSSTLIAGNIISGDMNPEEGTGYSRFKVNISNRYPGLINKLRQHKVNIETIPSNILSIRKTNARLVTFSEFMEKVENDQISSAEFSGNTVAGDMNPGDGTNYTRYNSYIPEDYPELINKLRAHKVNMDFIQSKIFSKKNANVMPLTFSEFMDKVENDQISSAEISGNTVTGDMNLEDGTNFSRYESHIPQDYPELIDRLRMHKVMIK